MPTYNPSGQINLTVVGGTVPVGHYAADGSWNIVVNAGTGGPIGLMHPSGAYNAVVVTDPGSPYYSANGSMNVIANAASPSGFSPVQPRGFNTVAPVTTAFDPATKSPNVTLSNNNLTITGVTNGAANSTVSKTTGQYYCEFSIIVATGVQGIGLTNATAGTTTFPGVDFNGVGWITDGRTLLNNANVASIDTWGGGSTLRIAADLTAKLIWFQRDAGFWNANASANPATGVGGTSFATVSAGPYFIHAYCGNVGIQYTANFGNTAYTQAAPVGFGNWV